MHAMSVVAEVEAPRGHLYLPKGTLSETLCSLKGKKYKKKKSFENGKKIAYFQGTIQL